MIGTVATFDPDVGLGTIAPAAGGTALAFHCIAIADGSRHIEPGTAVEYDLIPKLGHYEAWVIRPA